MVPFDPGGGARSGRRVETLAEKEEDLVREMDVGEGYRY